MRAVVCLWMVISVWRRKKKYSAYDHSSKVVRAIMEWSSTRGLEGLIYAVSTSSLVLIGNKYLIPIAVDLTLENATEVLVDSALSASGVAYHDLQSGELCEIIRPMVANGFKMQINIILLVSRAEVSTYFVEFFSLRARGEEWSQPT